MAVLRWQDPPARSGAGANYDADIEDLKDNPGKWGVIKDDWKTTAAPAAFRQNGCEVTIRRNKDGKTFTIYARWPRPKAGAPAAQRSPEKDKVRAAVQTGTALTPPRPAPKQNPVPQPASAVKPANDFGLDAFRRAREARGVPVEGKR